MDLARWRSYQGPVETPAPTSAPRVVVLGGGYVAINVCKALRESVANREIDLTVVSGDNFQTFHGFVGEMITGRLSPSHILSPVRRMFAPARVRVGEIEKIDLAGRRAVVARQLDGHRTEIT